MKTFFITILLFLSLSTFSQNYIGYSGQELVSFGATYLKTEKSDLTDFSFYRKASDTGVWLYSVPSYYGYCTDIVCIPTNKTYLHAFIDILNTDYIFISTDKWRMYDKGNVIDVTLKYSPEDGYTFVYSLIKE